MTEFQSSKSTFFSIFRIYRKVKSSSKFIRENMQAGISNMEDIYELIIWNDTCAFRARMTTVLILTKGLNLMHFDKSCVKMSQNHTSNKRHFLFWPNVKNITYVMFCNRTWCFWRIGVISGKYMCMYLV